MQVVTLITDLGSKDYYTSILKGYLFSHGEGVYPVDISHDVEKFNILQASYLFKSVFQHFPENSFHLVGIKGHQVSSLHRFLLCYYKNHFIFCPDNGFFSLIYEQDGADIFELKPELFKTGDFFVRDVLAKAACLLSKGVAIKEIAESTDEYVEMLNTIPVNTPGMLKGKSVYVDSFGNVITNIHKDFFYTSCQNRKFRIGISSERISHICKSYNDVSPGKALALFNSFGFLEIAINTGNARQLLFPKTVKENDELSINIEWEE